MSARVLVLLADVGLFLLVLAGVFAVLVALARYVGLGRCRECGAAIPPWNAFCWTHSPFREEP